MKLDFETLKSRLPGMTLDWLLQSRREAFTAFQNSGWPSRKEEAWKYTSTHNLQDQAFEFSVTDTASQQDFSKIATLPAFHLPGVRLVFVDGSYESKLSTDNNSLNTQGIQIQPLTQALKKNAEQLQKYLSFEAENDSGRSLLALNHAFMQEGFVLFLEREAVVSQSIHCIFIHTEKAPASAYCLKNFVFAAQKSKARIVEHFYGVPHAHASRYFVNANTQIFLEAHAEVEHIKLIQHSDRAFHFDALQITQEASSKLSSHVFTLNGHWVRSDTEVALKAQHASCELNGFFYGTKDRHMDHHTVVHHQTSDTQSDELYKGLMDGKSKGVFNGSVKVEPHAQKTLAAQSSKNLLLSRTAEINTKPELQIFANDVKCVHGATVGQLDDNALFYLKARGLDAETAKALLVLGFVSEMFEKIEDDALQQYVEKQFLGCLARASIVLEAVEE